MNHKTEPVRRNIVFVFLTIVMMTLVLSCNVFAEEYRGSDYLYLYEINQDNTATITYIDLNGDNVHDLIIPDTLNGHTVTAIGDGAFNRAANRSFLGLNGELRIPDTVTSIGDSAFKDCFFFTKLTLGSGLRTIGNYAFSSSSGYDNGYDYRDRPFPNMRFSGSLVIPAGVKDIGDYGFAGCSSFTSLSLPAGLKTIGEGAFSSAGIGNYRPAMGFTGELIIPEGITDIGDYAFAGCTGFTSLSLNDGLKTIGEGAFRKQWIGDGYLDMGFAGNLSIPATVTSIGDYAFNGCSGFTSLSLPEGLKTIGKGVFNGCSGIGGELIFPVSLTKIDEFAFYGCGIRKVTIPNVLLETPGTIFEDCSNLMLIINRSKAKIYPPSITIHYTGPYGEPVTQILCWKNAKNPKIKNLDYIKSGVAIREDFTGIIGVNLDDPDFDPVESEEENGGKDNTEIENHNNEPMDYFVETKGDYRATYYHSIPFWGKTKVTPENFGGITISCNSGTYKANKIKVNKKKRLIQITGLEEADKATVKAVKKATKGANGLPFNMNRYFVSDSDTVTVKKKKDGSIKSVEINIYGKKYKPKKNEWSFDSSLNRIDFKGENLAGSHFIK